jgi:hypothetical protein
VYAGNNTIVTMNFMAINEYTSEVVQLTCPKALLLEQVMRRTDDESLVFSFLDASPRSDVYMVALGRLLAASPGPVPAGTPLHIWAATGTLHKQWRDLCPPVRSSIWGELTTLRALFGADYQTDSANQDIDPVLELQELRSRS